MAQRHWGVFLCQCEQTLAVDAQRIGNPAAVVSVVSGPGVGLQAFAEAIERENVEDVLIGCCAEQGRFMEALEGKIAPNRLHFLNLKEKCFSVHQELDGANEKAARMIRGAIGALSGAPGQRENLLRVEERVLVFAAEPGGLRLAELLKGMKEVTAVLDQDAEKPAKGKATGRGALGAVSGRLGAFKVMVEPWQDPDARPQKPRAYEVGQLAVVASELPAHIRARTGVHWVRPGDEEGLETAAQEIRELVGLFRKPEQVTYDPQVCAGGAAGIQTCGRCLPACPYDAIQRDGKNPLRVVVEQLACEGCGACASACPTSALSFADPSPKELYARLAGLLAPLALPAPGDGTAPRPVVLFHCGEMGERVLNYAAHQGLEYPASVVPVEVPCLRFVSEANMLATLRMGAAGVGLLGCETCPHGERELLLHAMDFAGRVLKAFGMDADHIRLLTAQEGTEAEALTALTNFAASLGDSGLKPVEKPPRQTGNRDAMAYAIQGLIEATGKEPGGIKVPHGMPFGFAEVAEEGCTLCRACINVCPPHAFRMQPGVQALEFKAVNCIGCRLCEQACPEKVITVRQEFYLEREALDYIVVVQDEAVACTKCKKPFINRRALESIEAKVLGLDSLLDTFMGNRQNLLRMCPDCRAVFAMYEVDGGWEP